MTSRHDVRRLDPTQTHDLRRRVLRGGDPDAAVEWPGDDDPDAVHLGVVAGGRVVAVSTWRPSPAPDGRPGVRLRGMATEPDLAGRGHGRALLVAGVERARSLGAEVAWAHARVSALGFYERAGWTALGPVFETPDTGLPHRVVVLELGDR